MVLKNKNITIYIGMPEYASSALQNNFFLSLPFINYACIGYDNKIEKCISHIIYQDDAYFNFKEERDKLIKNFNKDFPTIVSSAMACGPVIPLFWNITQNRAIIASRFNKIFPNANILIITQNQFDIHKSFYAQLLNNKNSIISSKRSNFKSWIDLNIDLYNQGIDNIFSFADYYSLYNIYKSLFKNVKLVLFEEMIQDIEKILRFEIYPYSGINADIALPFFKKQKSPPNKKIFISKNFLSNKIKTKFNKHQTNFIMQFYSKGNKNLEIQTGLNFRKYNYPM